MKISLASCLLVFCSGCQALGDKIIGGWKLLPNGTYIRVRGNTHSTESVSTGSASFRSVSVDPASGGSRSGNQEVMDKLKMLENKIANLETESENIKKENENMKDLMKVTVLRSCAEYSHYGLQTSGRYMIDPDGKLTGQEPFQVYCNFSSGATEVFHDTEIVTEIEHCHDPGCYNKKISYINGLTTEPINMTQILSLMVLSESCTQDIRYDCTLAPLERNGVNYAWWKDREGEDNIYFTGSHYNQHVCDCHYSPDGCVNAELLKNQCNCNAYRPVATTDTGTITNMSALPIMEMFAGGLDFKVQVGSFQIGRLKCYGEKEVETATSCSSLKKEGVMTSGYYNIKPLGPNHVKLVFCDMKTDTYNDVRQTEESDRDGSPLGTISAWVSKPAGDGSPEQLPNGWVLCDGSLIKKGIWAGARTPDLNSGHFLRGGNLGQQLQMEEDQLQDHKHTDPGHSHSASSSSSASSHSHSYHDTFLDGPTGSSGIASYANDGGWTYHQPKTHYKNTGNATVRVSTKTKVRSHSTGISGVTSSYRHGAETRPKNMKVSWIMKCW